MGEYERAYNGLYEALRAAGHTPQVAARKINRHYRASLQKLAGNLWDIAEDEVSCRSEAEREHLRYVARWLGYEPKEGTDGQEGHSTEMD